MTVGISLATVPGDNQTTPPANTPPANTPPTPAKTQTTPPANTPDPFAGLSEGNRQIAQTKGWKSMDDALASYTALEKQFSSTRPHVKPDKPDAYTFTLPKDLPKGVNYSTEFEGAYKKWAFDAELSPEQAGKLHGAFFGFAAEQAKAAEQAMIANVEKAAGALTEKWGTPESPTFKQNVEMGKRAIRHLDPNLKTELERTGVIAKVNGQEMIANPVIFEALTKVGLSMFAEDSQFGSPASDKNPFAADGEDLAMQGRIFKEDPQKAKLLIMASGRSQMFQFLLDKIK